MTFLFCPACPGFPDAWSLRRHIQTHTGALPFKCPYCDSRFQDNRPRKKHLRTAHGIDDPTSVLKLKPGRPSSHVDRSSESCPVNNSSAGPEHPHEESEEESESEGDEEIE